MKKLTTSIATGASAIALVMGAVSASAQDGPDTAAQEAETEAPDTAGEPGMTDEEIVATGAVLGGGAYAVKKLGFDKTDVASKIAKNIGKVRAEGLARKAAAANQPSAGDLLKARGANAAPRNIQTLQSSGNARAAIGNGSQLDDLVRRGQSAQAARAPRAAGSAADVINTRAAAQGPRNIQTLRSPAEPRGVTFRDGGMSGARANVAGSADELADLAKRGKSAQAARAATGGPKLGTRVIVNGGDLGKVLNAGDAARAARGLDAASEASALRGIAANGGNISDLNKAGRTAQAARGAGGLKALGKVDDAAKLAKIAKTGAAAGKVGKAGRAALAGTGVGAAVVVAEIVATESVEALTGADIQDPISTTFQYGAAVFDKDVKISDVAKQRLQHHRDNLAAIGKTLTTKGQLKKNLQTYGADKKEKFQENMRKFGNNMEKLDGNLKQAGATNRALVGSITGADMRSVEETSNRYKEALAGDNKIKNTAKVMGDRAKHHVENTKKVTKKVGSKVACGIGNIFKKKENDKDC
ncbi:hypothetical protein [Erythrobacter sp. MTPC3]|uniref:hypothetical protein n=1 Tax=Erythrobacter sp. MTPC3 TaxID=3056564 RepID=UPI0036F20915